MALRRTSSFTGSEVQPDSRSWPMVAGRDDMGARLPSPHMELSGRWRAAEADEHLRRRYAEDGFDDAGWEPIEVPGHGRSTTAFAHTDGPLLYRRRFESPRQPEGARSWL